MVDTTTAELLFLPDTEELRFLPEGPTDLGDGKFSWVAIQHGADAKHGSLNIFDVSSRENQNFPLPGRPGFAKPTTQDGLFVVGCERALGLANTKDGSWSVLADGIDADVTDTIINDGTLFGSDVVFGTKDLAFATPKAGLYLYRGAEQQLTKLCGGQICSNGKDVVSTAAGGLYLIDIDSPTRKVVRYKLDVATGSLTDVETIVDLADSTGVPDGMVLSPDEQSMIISFYNPDPAPVGQTRQYSMLDGSLEHIWETPGSPQNTCPLLLPVDGAIKLIITTAVEHMPADRRGNSPDAGGLFIADTNFVSPPTATRFPID